VEGGDDGRLGRAGLITHPRDGQYPGKEDIIKIDISNSI